jgi:hypothetical protein
MPTIPAGRLRPRTIQKHWPSHPPGGSWRRFIASGYLIEAASLDALAGKIVSMRRACAIPCNATTAAPRPATTRSSAKARLTDRQRRSAAQAEPCLGPIAHPPYYAMAVYPSTPERGLRADADGRALTATASRLRAVRLWKRHGLDHVGTIRGQGSRFGPASCLRAPHANVERGYPPPATPAAARFLTAADDLAHRVPASAGQLSPVHTTYWSGRTSTSDDS